MVYILQFIFHTSFHLIHMHARCFQSKYSNIICMQGVFNPNILIYHPPNSAEGLHFNAFHCYRHCGCPACVCVCVCVSVRSFLPPRASISRNIGTCVFTATRKTLYIGIIIVIFAENASSISYGRRHLLAPNATNRS